MKQIALSLLLLSNIYSIAQQQTPYIEIIGEDNVKAEVNSVEVSIMVRSSYAQVEEAFYDEYGYYPYNDMFGWEEDYDYERMMEENPKKVSKEMREAYEARQKEMEDRMAQYETFESTFDPFDFGDLQELLKNNGFSFETKTEEYEYDESNYALVIVKNSEDLVRLQELSDSHPVYSSISEVEYQDETELYKTALPAIAKNAREEADMIATALGGKTGKVLMVSNNIPESSEYSYGYEEEYYDDYYYEEFYFDNPFEDGKEIKIALIFRFELIQ